MDKKRVVLVSSNVLPSLGGVELYNDALYDALERNGYAVTLVTTTRNSDRLAIELDAVQFFNGRFPVPLGVRHFVRTLRHCLASGPQPIVILQTRIYPLNLIAAIAARSRRIRTIVIDHSTGHLSIDTRWLQGCADAYDHIATALLRACGCSFWSVSAASARWLRHFGISDSAVVPNAVRDDILVPSHPKTHHAGTLLAVFAGRLVADKGLPETIEALNALHENGSRWSLAVAGDGPLLPYLQTRVSDRIRYLGKLPHDDFIALLRSADAVVLPTVYPEGLPTVALEAGALGVPLVATESGGLRELLADGLHGLILARPSPSEIAAALDEIERDPAGAAERSAKLRRYVAERHTWGRVAAMILDRLEGEGRR